MLDFNVPVVIGASVTAADALGLEQPGIQCNADDDVPTLNPSQCILKAVTDYQLMPYHRLGVSKYGYLDREYYMGDVDPPDGEIILQRP